MSKRENFLSSGRFFSKGAWFREPKERQGLRGLKLVGIQFTVQRPPRHWSFNPGKMAKTNLYPWKYFPVDLCFLFFLSFFFWCRESKGLVMSRRNWGISKISKKGKEKDIFTVIRFRRNDCSVYTTCECAFPQRRRMTQFSPTNLRVFSGILEMKEWS